MDEAGIFESIFNKAQNYDWSMQYEDRSLDKEKCDLYLNSLDIDLKPLVNIVLKNTSYINYDNMEKNDR